MVLVQKWPFLQLFFIGNIGQENVFYDILERKNVFLTYKNQKLKKSKIDIFPKGLTHGFNPKMAICPTFFFRQYRPRKCLLRYSRTKKRFFIGNIGQENVFYDILERKNVFLTYKNQKLKKSKIDIFPKGLTHGFNPKMAIFPTFFFRQYRPRKCLLRYSRTKKRFSTL